MLTRRAALTAIAGLIAAPHARAQSFPSRNISIVVPYPAGGPVDAVARLIAQSHPARSANRSWSTTAAAAPA